MSINLSVRVFRRNLRNTIIIWNGAALLPSQREKVAVFLFDENGMDTDKQLSFSKFVPDSPEKFSADVSGVVIPHAENKMDPVKQYNIRVIFGEGDDSMEITKPVMAANSIDFSKMGTAKPTAHLYAMDYETNTWVPWPVTGVFPSNIQFGIQAAEGKRA